MHFLLLSNPLFNAYQGSDFFGKAIFISLFILSIVTWSLFIKKFFIFREIKEKGERFQQAFQKKRYQPLALEVGETNHPFAFLYRTMKEHAADLMQRKKESGGSLVEFETKAVEVQLQQAVSFSMRHLEKNVFLLSTIVSLAPFLGLLGTVWGILLTFAELTAGTTSVNSNEVIMGGLAMALGTTVVGLLVAIPALLAYNYLKSCLSYFSLAMEDFSSLLVASLNLEYHGKKDE